MNGKFAGLIAVIVLMLPSCRPGATQDLPGSTDIVRLAIVPHSVHVIVGGSVSLVVFAHLRNGDSTQTAATWSASGGVINASGVYTAGATPGTFPVVATQTGGTVADTSTVTILASLPTLTTLTILPKTIALPPGSAQQFSAAGTWSDGSAAAPLVTWSATGGTISTGGRYVAGATAGSYQVIATQADGTKRDTAVVTISTTAPPPFTGVTLTVDPSVRFQTIDGFGATIHLFDEPHITQTFDPVTQRGAVVIPASEQAAIRRTLYTDIGLTRYRAATVGNVEPVNDNSDPNVTDLSKFNFAWVGGDGFIADVAANKPYGLTTFYGAPIFVSESWMSRTDPAEEVEWEFVQIQHWANAGQPLPYWSILNEPGWQGGGVTVSGAYVRDAVKQLGAKLAAAGLNTKLVIPDDVNPTESLNRAQVILADPVARQYVGAISTHVYDAVNPPLNPNFNSLAALSALAKQYNLPFWMSEWYTSDWFVWARTMHSLMSDYNVSAVDYAFGFFGTWANPAQLVEIMSSGTTYTGFAVRPVGWVTRQWARYVRPGSQRVQVTSSDASVQVTAFLNGSTIVVVALNTGSSTQPLQVTLAGTMPFSQATAERTSASESGATLAPITLTGRTLTSALPATSVTTFVVQP